MENHERITVLLGAGAMMDVTALSCDSITKSVIAKQQVEFRGGVPETVPFLEFVYEQLKAYYLKDKESVNFEDIFHALEMWSSIKTTENEHAVKAFRSVFGMLCNLKGEFAQVSETLIYRGLHDLVDTVIENVAEYEQHVYKDRWFSDFFKALLKQSPLDVFTLNYDTWLEQIIEDYNDGFVPFCETHQKFSANRLFSNEGSISTVNHLHGQICFTTHLPTGSKRLLTDGWYKANSYGIVKDLRIYPKHPGFMAKTQAAEHVYQYPIITGLRKNEKIMTPPFDAYYTHLYHQLRSNKNLLIVGYGFGDLYINGLLNQFRSFHGDKGKVICIGYLGKEKWIHNVAEMPISNSMKQTIYMLFQDYKLPHRFLGFEPSSCISSSDEKSRLYLSGFKSAINFYRDDILNFFR